MDERRGQLSTHSSVASDIGMAALRNSHDRKGGGLVVLFFEFVQRDLAPMSAPFMVRFFSFSR